MNGKNPRQIALEVLQHRRTGEFAENLLEPALGRATLSALDRGLAHELVYGVIRWQATLDWLIEKRTDGRRQKPLLQNVLRLGLYQIFWLERIPEHAAVHETVELAKRSGFPAQARFINALLRGYLREAEGTRKMLAGLKLQQPALGYSHPEWLWARWRQRWGAERAAELMAWNNTPPKTFARVNTLKSGTGVPVAQGDDAAARLLVQWRDENVDYDFVRHDWIEENLVFELKAHPGSIAALPSFQQGLFYVQDPGTLLAVKELDPRPGETILDMCAAPGGKLTHIAQLMRNEGTLTAHELGPDRLKLVKENCARLGVTCVNTATPSTLDPRRSFDRILVDAPCSNTGVMRRRVDLRWRITPEEIQRLRDVQLGLLRQAAARLKPGGTLVYSTCSLEPEENQAVVKEFLSEGTDLKSESERELLPFRDQVDGAYVARLRSGQP